MFDCSEQLLFSCVSSKVIVCHAIYHMSYFTYHMSNAYFDPWYMPNNFCFHVYAQKSLIIGENGNVFFYQFIDLDPS